MAILASLLLLQTLLVRKKPIPAREGEGRRSPSQVRSSVCFIVGYFMVMEALASTSAFLFFITVTLVLGYE